MSLKVFPIAFSDNYIWALVSETSCVIVDAGQEKPVLDFLKKHNLNLEAILITHHHFDHIEGVLGLKNRYKEAQVYGPKGGHIEGVDYPVGEGDSLVLKQLDMKLKVLETPGHTLDHLSYVCKGHIFCGDTLFSAGCGRLFEGTAADMYRSFQKLLGFPDDTLLYGGHEYTGSNLAFARHIEPNNPVLDKETSRIKHLRAQQKPSLPTSIRLEKKINPFARVNDPEIKAIAEKKAGGLLNSPEQVFATLRSWKDTF